MTAVVNLTLIDLPGLTKVAVGEFTSSVSLSLSPENHSWHNTPPGFGIIREPWE